MSKVVNISSYLDGEAFNKHIFFYLFSYFVCVCVCVFIYIFNCMLHVTWSCPTLFIYTFYKFYTIFSSLISVCACFQMEKSSFVNQIFLLAEIMFILLWKSEIWIKMTINNIVHMLQGKSCLIHLAWKKSG